MLEKLESKQKSVHVIEELLGAIDVGRYKVGDKLSSGQVIVKQTLSAGSAGGPSFCGDDQSQGREWDLH